MQTIYFFLFFLCFNLATKAQNITLVKDVNQFANTFINGASLVKDNVIYFLAKDPSSGADLWRSDGTPTGTYLLKDLAPGPMSVAEIHLAKLNDLIIVSCLNNVDGHLEIWKTDGTTTGTELVKSFPEVLNVFSAWNDRELVQAGNWVYFVADDGVHGPELWRTDGTPFNTVMVADTGTDNLPQHAPQLLTAWNTGLLYIHYTPATGIEYWRSDGTASGTQLLKDIHPGAAGSVPPETFNRPYDLIPTPLGVFFVANDGTHGPELWKTDGTENGTVLLADLNADSTTLGAKFNPLSVNYAFLNGRFYFQGITFNEGHELWSTNGTTAGTAIVADATPGYNIGLIRQMGIYGNKLIFNASSNQFYEKLWVSDGTATGTYSLQGSNNFVSVLDQLIPYGGKMWFAGQDTQDVELWQTDGTVDGTLQFADLFPGAESSFPQFLGVVNGHLLFFAKTEAANKYQLFRLDAPAVATSAPTSPSLEAIRLWPNPARDFVQVELESLPAGSYEVRTFRTDGVLQRQQLITLPGTLDVHGLVAGMYWIEIRGEASAVKCITRLLVQPN
jgi:ELWxxDGT repeat protein